MTEKRAAQEALVFTNGHDKRFLALCKEPDTDLHSLTGGHLLHGKTPGRTNTAACLQA